MDYNGVVSDSSYMGIKVKTMLGDLRVYWLLGDLWTAACWGVRTGCCSCLSHRLG